MTVGTRHLRADGSSAGVDAGPVSYRWERSQAAGRWKTTMTFRPRTMPVGQGANHQEFDDPLAVVRIEDDENGSSIRMYGRDGRRLAPPSIESLQNWIDAANPSGHARSTLSLVAPQPVAAHRATPATDREWVSAFVATPQQKATRRARLTQQFVKRGQVRGLDRYTRAEADRTREVLIDAAAAVPLEINLLQGNATLSRNTFSYDTAPDGTMVRRLVHAELTTTVAGDRTIVDTTYTNVHTERR